MMRRLFTPRWLLVHLGVAALVVLMVNLGFWQLNRLDEKRTFNATLSARTTEPIVDLSAVIPTAAGLESATSVADSLEWRRVRVSGTYDRSEAITVVNRSQNGTAGLDTVVPLRLDDGRVVLANRGFVPLSMAVPGPPSKRLEVVGYLRASQARSALGPTDSSDVNATEFQRIDLTRLARQIEGPMVPMWLQVSSESISAGTQWPAPVILPELTEGPHLSYAVQWFFFSAVALAAWVVVVRRRLYEP